MIRQAFLVCQFLATLVTDLLLYGWTPSDTLDVPCVPSSRHTCHIDTSCADLWTNAK